MDGAGLLAAQEIRTVQVAAGVAAPSDIQNAGDGSGRLFLVQQNGLIRILRDGALVSTPFLDIRTKTRLDGERGLLGLAFPPGFRDKQRFYVDYTDLNGDTIIAHYRVTANPDVADAASETVLLKIAQPFSNHNGGQVRFGPDGYLYIGMGDGGSGGDPQGNGQNLGALLGKTAAHRRGERSWHASRIPAGQSFRRTAGARGEIWAYGLRNPWRFSFDRATRDLWIADVGQDTYEEVDFQPASSHGGENYGWNRMEGHALLRGGLQYDRDHAAGGRVHARRREAARSPEGSCTADGSRPGCAASIFTATIAAAASGGWSGRAARGAIASCWHPGFSITTFGEDEAGEIYVANARQRDHSPHRRQPRAAAQRGGRRERRQFRRGHGAGIAGNGVRRRRAGRCGVAGSGAGSAADRAWAASRYRWVGSPRRCIPIEQRQWSGAGELSGAVRRGGAIHRAGGGDARRAGECERWMCRWPRFSPASIRPTARRRSRSMARTTRWRRRRGRLAAGEYAFVYVSGLGAVSNAPADGDGRTGVRRSRGRRRMYG